MMPRHGLSDHDAQIWAVMVVSDIASTLLRFDSIADVICTCPYTGLKILKHQQTVTH
jgi:hypothetical protein